MRQVVVTSPIYPRPSWVRCVYVWILLGLIRLCQAHYAELEKEKMQTLRLQDAVIKHLADVTRKFSSDPQIPLKF